MPDIDPAALSRPTVSLSTPILSTKTLSITAPGSQKTPKTSQIIPARIDLEPLYSALKSAIGPEQWLVYKDSLSNFLLGRLNQTEFSSVIDPILTSANGEKEHLHNQLIAAIYGNVTREMPDQGPAPWVSANDKPVPPTGSKPVSGDAAERRLKGEVMQLPARDRRRIKDLIHNDYDPYENIHNVISDAYRKPTATNEVPPSAGGGINNMNLDLEIRKRFTHPLAVESGEFPDVSMIGARMLPHCYEAGLVNGHASDAPHLMSVATENFIKEVLTQVFSRTRSNKPGDLGVAGNAIGTQWVQTQRYRRQLDQEEDALQRGELSRDKSGLLPIEAKAASERGPLGMADFRVALEMADIGLARFPILVSQVLYGYREGELENWDDYTWATGKEPEHRVEEIRSKGINGVDVHDLPNGHSDAMDIDNDMWWEGAENQDVEMLDGLLDSCLAVGS
ncbi:transcriptional regulator of RNA polII, SAGA, subunit-domain-containing protein [Stachybotrys elegans]|uniref:Transcriptional regulator of RNA polII, SAGA, subunit-domain-containing protein n=1 Tax=Stachybotrys elegans TaxID=80388 RepID=A0A8K0T387_9HYPO|nr:transcriptional regulator of RNA polII, SAGA, subunit-domain-containing protein [Stachybotrys elegans]